MKAKATLKKETRLLLKDLMAKVAGHDESVRLLLSQYDVYVPADEPVTLKHIYVAGTVNDTFMRNLYAQLYKNNVANSNGEQTGENGFLYWLGKAGSGLQAIFGDFSGGTQTDQTFANLQTLQAMQLQETQLKAEQQSKTIILVIVVLAILAVIGFSIMAMKKR